MNSRHVEDDEPSQPVSDRALRAFCEAARWGSLTRAADHLGLGQSAISHAISRLESAMGLRLLDRSRAGVVPTEAGARLLEAVEPAFESIDEAVRSTRADDRTATVSLSVSTSLAGWWLLPRLPDFKRRHPEVNLRLVTTDTDLGIDSTALDLWIPLGIVERPNLEATELCHEALIPVAAPSLASELRTAGRQALTPGDLATAPLLHLEERYAPRFDWPRWFAHHDVTTTDRLPGDRSNDYSLVVQAALDGQGVALGWRHIVADLIDAGRLVALAEPLVTDRPFVVLRSNRRAPSSGAVALRRWLTQTMQVTETAPPRSSLRPPSATFGP